METIITTGLLLLGIYCALGLLFAIPFLWKGANQIDEGVAGSTRSFKLIILPGTILLWPALLRKWLKSRNL
ncbi:MAG: hypothetical protein AAFY48_05905 [Bacteroidota bacterium]